MARFDTSGLEDIINEMDRLSLMESDVVDKMLLAGAEQVKRARRKSAERHGLRATGAMIESIGYPRKPKTIDGIRSIDIYAQGKDQKGTRNAEKEFILNYGTSRIKATHWVDEADEAAAEPVQEAMEQVFNDYINGKE